MLKERMSLFADINLCLFDGGGDGGSGDSGGEGAPELEEATTPKTKKTKDSKSDLSKVVYGKQSDSTQKSGQPAVQTDTLVTADTVEARKAEFEKLISSDYKDLYSDRVQQIIDKRFKNYKPLEAKIAALEPVLQLLSQKHGVDANDVESLARAIEEDESYYEEEAMQRGLTVEQLKIEKQLLRENEQLKNALEERQKVETQQQTLTKWQQEETELQKFYPGFSLEAEAENPDTGKRFLAILTAPGGTMKAAYEAVHIEDILGGAMQYTAQQVAQKITNDIRTRGMRPAEVGANVRGSGTVFKTDPRTFTKEDRKEISKRVARGEIISF